MDTQTKLSAPIFLSKLITQYAYIHGKTVGKTAEEYIRQIGLRTGEWIESFYQEEGRPFTVDQYADVIVDLKNSIGGRFTISSVHEDHVVVKATACPFGDVVKDAPHLCNMTSSVFGGIASRNFGYAEVFLRKRIAVGDAGCEVAIYFQPTGSGTLEYVKGETYKNLRRTPDNGDPFRWEEETIVLLNEQLRRSDEMVLRLLEELEELREQVRNS
ncbi:sigma-54 dependent transcriptional regulator [Bacillus coahuilensis p1.1.43]|uniref:Sigma-54 dependent transcriptional regulator n=1 Tax=Bacillus coahuilensis p1.1.43 TaxID=1150625 RepID=A0A147K425_9BACI|nr:methanogen output domain 1-containing protein [Bacillus coahuilensis]KUP04034.1 sigma-54 dependent transcriptional regulator [Bacillus coahuilensis p1.1.43]